MDFESPKQWGKQHRQKHKGTTTQQTQLVVWIRLVAISLLNKVREAWRFGGAGWFVLGVSHLHAVRRRVFIGLMSFHPRHQSARVETLRPVPFVTTGRGTVLKKRHLPSIQAKSKLLSVGQRECPFEVVCNFPGPDFGRRPFSLSASAKTACVVVQISSSLRCAYICLHIASTFDWLMKGSIPSRTPSDLTTPHMHPSL